MTSAVEKEGGDLLLELIQATREELKKTDEQGRRSSAWGAVARAICKDLNIQAPKSNPEVKKFVQELPSFEDEVPFAANPH